MRSMQFGILPRLVNNTAIESPRSKFAGTGVVIAFSAYFIEEASGSLFVDARNKVPDEGSIVVNLDVINFTREILLFGAFPIQAESCQRDRGCETLRGCIDLRSILIQGSLIELHGGIGCCRRVHAVGVAAELDRIQKDGTARRTPAVVTAYDTTESNARIHRVVLDFDGRVAVRKDPRVNILRSESLQVVEKGHLGRDWTVAS